VFERYTEKARRVIFFSRYEASQLGSPYIETEHLLLGLIRDNPQIVRLLPIGSAESIRKQVEVGGPNRPARATSVDLPLSNESKRVLAYAAEEAERLSHKHIGTEHLLLGLLREEKCFAAELLRERGLTILQLREEFAKGTWPREFSRPLPKFRTVPIEIHGFAMDADSIRERVNSFRKFNWHWHKSAWKARDLAVDEQGRISLDASLTADTKNFTLNQGGWKKDLCAICRWELFESEDQPDHGTGYTNGRDWVCTECYEKFLSGPDFFASAHPDIT
jgi:hypothetical protein